MTLCVWCREHPQGEPCPRLGVIAIREEEPRSDADDANDALQERNHRLRAFARGLLADLHAAGLQPSPITLALAPANESFDP